MSENFKDFTTEEQEFVDACIEALGESLLDEEKKSAIVNPSRAKLVLYLYKTLKSTARGAGVRVSYKMHEPIKSMGYVIVSGKNVSFKDPKVFFEAAKLCDNFDVCPKTDGTVEMNFTVHNLTIPIE